ncbi:MAG TPA: valine--tRNA ligase [Anaeromyxobacteraceae bacterium]|nr:valine--tRNA ligase [Anaeromyxobacteraceae bacterium]
MSTGTAQEPRTTELAKAYEHRDVEGRWYRVWMERGYFHGDENDTTRPPFSIVLPPPNVTGSLHLGHALTATLQDILIRWKKMSGFNTLWLPGTDHAGIATQMVVEKELVKTEGKSRHDLGRPEFLKRVWAWKERFGSRIGEQHQALGASLDWERERFTMDEGLSRAVREVFVTLYEQGLIYREKTLINWCPRCHTALSDLEVNHEEGHKGELWSFAYPLSDGSGEVVVATTRPETMLGDTAVAVHPDDERYKAIVGKMVRHPITGREFPVIADSILVDPAFGTGAVKVTPAHDFNDFEVGKRHGLPAITVIGLDGKMNTNAGPLVDQDRFEARKNVKKIIAELGLDRESKPHVLPLGRCQRCETVLEPMLSWQWFVKIAPLAQPAIEAVEQGKTRFIPEQWTNTYMAWMRNIHDWCISRQLWWGHQIPAWYCPDGHVTVAREAPQACSTCGSATLRQEEDVLDTWFSSSLWPFSTMGWPEKTRTLQTFYPTSVMETGHDIIFFWVARMMMMGIHFMGEVPFRTVYLHPMVRDEKGQKMSKTKGNVIDPLVITEQYGADALRFTLAALTAQGRDIKLAKERIEGYRAFANKLWNATRFTLMNLSGFTVGLDPHKAARTAADRWILARLQRAVNETVEALDGFHFNEAANTVYQFVWRELCDWYIELSKEALYGDDAEKKIAAQAILVHCLETSYRLLHPMMPFITEELWNTLAAQVGGRWGDSLMTAAYPKPGPVDEDAERSFNPVIGVIEAIRNIRGEMNVPFKTPLADVEVGALEQSAHATVAQEKGRIERLSNATVAIVAAGRAPTKRGGSAVAVGEGFELRVGLAGAIDLAAESARIDKELSKVEQDLTGIERKLANPSFVERAPAEVVEKDRARSEELRDKRRKLEAHRAMLQEAEGTMETPNPAAETITPTAQVAETPPPEAPAAAPDTGETTPPQGEAETARQPKARRAPAKKAAKPARKAAKPAKKAPAAKKAAKPAKKVARKAAKPARAAKKTATRGAKKTAARGAKKVAKPAKKMARKPARKTAAKRGR